MPLNLDLKDIYNINEFYFFHFDANAEDEIEEFDNEYYQLFLKIYCKYTDINIDQARNKEFKYFVDIVKYFSSEEVYERVKMKLDNQLEKYGMKFWVPEMKKAINEYNAKTVGISDVKIFKTMVKFLYEKLDRLFIWDMDIESILEADEQHLTLSITETSPMEEFIYMLLKH